ncbi:V-type ATP synthase subunit F [Acholeplasma hippikon]|uniref:V-type ATP synthase subunit F n=1 Tax=Acholeplasma hippikon TaxID=264636 RepID=A0A449BHT1_9MOLU|nr:V-type ATP synthase subunit F [Acholeplasma hippikon]VEU82014.1 V-type ATP synthase subunit F [Acholeplasma hippikon]
MREIIALTKNDSFMILQSIGIEVSVLTSVEEFKKKVKQAVQNQTKIIIYDSESSDIMNELIAKYDENLYPIFLKLPSNIHSEDSLLELKLMIEKSIGISVI